MFYADGGGTRADIDSDVHSLGDASVGVGYALPSPPFSNDGVVVRGMIKLPSGDEGALAGSGGYSASAWAETSGAFPGSAVSRNWLYAATLGVLAGEAPEELSDIGGRLIAFGRFGVSWRALEDLHLTVQIEAHSSPYGGSALSPLSDPAVMLGLGGTLSDHGAHGAGGRGHGGRRHLARRARHRPSRGPAVEIVGDRERCHGRDRPRRCAVPWPGPRVPLSRRVARPAEAERDGERRPGFGRRARCRRARWW